MTIRRRAVLGADGLAAVTPPYHAGAQAWPYPDVSGAASVIRTTAAGDAFRPLPDTARPIAES